MTSTNPIVDYSEIKERAQLFDVFSQEGSEREEESSEKDETIVELNKKQRKAIKKRRKGINVVQGFVYLKLVGFQGKHRLSAAQLVSYIPLKVIKKAGAKILKSQGIKRKRRKPRKF